MIEITPAYPINNTNFISGVSDKCFDWCKDQHFIHESNLTVQGMSIPAIAMICLFSANVILKFDKIIAIKLKISPRNLTTVYILLHNLAFLLLLGFFIWFIFFGR